MEEFEFPASRLHSLRPRPLAHLVRLLPIVVCFFSLSLFRIYLPVCLIVLFIHSVRVIRFIYLIFFYCIYFIYVFVLIPFISRGLPLVLQRIVSEGLFPLLSCEEQNILSTGVWKLHLLLLRSAVDK